MNQKESLQEMVTSKPLTSYFHDGDLFSIVHEDGNLELFMESAEISEEALEEDIPISKSGSFPAIRGKLCFRGVKKILYNENLFTGRLAKTHDSFTIFHLEIKKNVVELQLILQNFHEQDEEFCTITIEADIIDWKRTPERHIFSSQELTQFADCFGRGFSDFTEPSLQISEDPKIRFKEAPIRILRVIRFAAILGCEIDSIAWKAMQEPASLQLLANIPQEELGDEFALIVGAAFPDYGVKLLLDSGIMLQWMQAAIKGSVYEGLMSPWSMDQNSVYHELTLEQHTLQVLKNSLSLHCDAPPEKKLVLRLTAICHDLGKMYQPIQGRNEFGSTSYHGHEDHSAALTELLLKYLKLDRYIAPVKRLVQHHMRPHDLVKGGSSKGIRKLLRDLAEEGVQWVDLLNQAEADAMAKSMKIGQEERAYLVNLNLLREKVARIEQEMEKQPTPIEKPLLNGFQLMEAFNRHDSGQWIAEILRWLQEQQLGTEISQEEAVAIVKKQFPQYIK
jgi:tRNA nucleotidyltransferase/poly(A) polymerase